MNYNYEKSSHRFPERRNKIRFFTLMKKVWSIQIELVQQLLAICEKYDLKR